MNIRNEIILKSLISKDNVLVQTGGKEITEDICKFINDMELNKSSDGDIQKALDISRLRRVRQMVTNSNGTVYMKTVYKKLDEVEQEKSKLFLDQQFIEENLEVGMEVNLRWKGSHTNTQYETNNAKILSFTDKEIRLALTAPFSTNNANNYVYPEGHFIFIPRINTEEWNGDNSISKKVRHQVVRQSRVQSVTEITNINEASIGDKIVYKKGDLTKNGVIIGFHVPREGITYGSTWANPLIKVKFEDGKEIFVNPASNRNSIKIVSEQEQKLSFFEGLDVLRAEGVDIKIPTDQQPPTRIQDGVEAVQRTVRVDRFGRKNRLGRQLATITEQRPKYRSLTVEEINNWSRDNNENSTYKQNYEKFDFVKFKDDFEKAYNNSGLTNFRTSELKITFKNDNEMQISYNDGGLQMRRLFTKVSDDNFKVYHAYFSVSSDKRDSGAMKKIFVAFNEQYRNLGVTDLRVSANIDIGAYAWSRCGFRASADEANKYLKKMRTYIGQSRVIQTRTGESYTITQNDYDEAKERVDDWISLNPGSEVPMRLLGGKTKRERNVAKATLLGHDNSWSGHINLRDDDQRNDFENYIYGINE